MPTARLISDEETIRRRAAGETLQSLSEAAGVNVSTMSQWLRREPQATALKDAKLLLAAETTLQEREAKAAKSKARRDRRRAKAAEPQPPAPWDRSTESYAAYVARSAAEGRRGKILRVRW
jgi:transcriptional regulator with XRE-family HTH domain